MPGYRMPAGHHMPPALTPSLPALRHALESIPEHALEGIDPSSMTAEEDFAAELQRLYEALMCEFVDSIAPLDAADLLYISQKCRTSVHQCRTVDGHLTGLVLKQAPIETAPTFPELQYVHYEAGHFEFSSRWHYNVHGAKSSAAITVSRYCEGGDLFGYIKKNWPVSPTCLALVVWKLSMQISYYARQQLLHCDVKLENIWIHNSMPYLADFGLAKMLTEGLKHVQCGSETYAPIEAMEEGGRNPPTKHDTWGLGVTLYACFTGDPLVEAKSTRSAYQYQIHSLDNALLAASEEMVTKHGNHLTVDKYISRYIKRTLDINPATRPPSDKLDLLLVICIWCDFIEALHPEAD